MLPAGKLCLVPHLLYVSMWRNGLVFVGFWVDHFLEILILRILATNTSETRSICFVTGAVPQWYIKQGC